MSGPPLEWIEAVQPFVTAGERSRAERFVHPVDAARHLVGRGLVRRVLSSTLDRAVTEDFALSQHGKPLYVPGEVNFSISHAGELVVAAFCINNNVGIDIENVRDMPDLADIATNFHPLETAEILAEHEVERTNTFFRCWTRKEAFLKATGTGLNHPLNRFRVRTDRTDQDWLTLLPPHAKHTSSGWTSCDIDIRPKYQCSIAADASPLDVTFSFIR